MKYWHAKQTTDCFLWVTLIHNYIGQLVILNAMGVNLRGCLFLCIGPNVD